MTMSAFWFGVDVFVWSSARHWLSIFQIAEQPGYDKQMDFEMTLGIQYYFADHLKLDIMLRGNGY